MANDASFSSFVAIGDSFTEGLNDFDADGDGIGPKRPELDPLSRTGS